MITNTFISLDRNSKIRTDALNTIKYTLLLDYNLPEFSDDKSLLDNIFKTCHLCCYRLFENDTPDNFFQELGHHFFGINTNYDDFHCTFSKIGTLQRVPGGIPSLFDGDMHSMILQHCVMSCYHAILTELANNKTLAAYSIAHNSPNRKSSDIPATKRSSNASNFQAISKTHIKALPFLSDIAYKKPFSDIWFNICEINVTKFKRLYNNEISDVLKLSKDLVTLESSLMPKYNGTLHRFQSSTAKSCYIAYLTERIFNFRLFYSVLKGIKFVNDQNCYRLDQKDLLPAISSCSSLPNVFSRQLFLTYALSHIDKETASNRDFWSSNDLSLDDNYAIESARRSTRVFDLYHWKEQFELFTNYLSEYVIPIYEWCFTCMLFDSIETKYTGENEDHTFHLNKAKELLETYIETNYDSIIHPIVYNPEWKYDADALDVTTPLSEIHTLSELSPDVVKELVALFFPADKTIDLNLSTHLNPEYFKTSVKKVPNVPNIRIRKFYIDLLRYNRWQ